MVAPAIIAAIIGAVGSAASQKMAADAQQQSSAMQASSSAAGGEGGFDLGVGTDKFMSTMRQLNETPDGKLTLPKNKMGAGMVEGALGDALNRGGSDQLSLGLEAATQGAANGGDPASGFAQAMAGGGEAGGGGFNPDQAMQYAAMAAQLGSMFSGPGAPPPPGLPGGGGWNGPEPFTMRQAYGR